MRITTLREICLQPITQKDQHRERIINPPHIRYLLELAIGIHNTLWGNGHITNIDLDIAIPQYHIAYCIVVTVYPHSDICAYQLWQVGTMQDGKCTVSCG